MHSENLVIDTQMKHVYSLLKLIFRKKIDRLMILL